MITASVQRVWLCLYMPRMTLHVPGFVHAQARTVRTERACKVLWFSMQASPVLPHAGR
jgi:hypothetical protein